MDKKFDSNVATQIPKTKMTYEPQLPWNVTQSDLVGNQFVDSVQTTPMGKVPLGVKPMYLIMLIALIFLCALSVFIFTAQSNTKVKAQVQRAEEEKALLVDQLKETANEANALKGKVETLESSIVVLGIQNKNLTEQNKDFMTVIKRMSENEEETQLINEGQKNN